MHRIPSKTKRKTERSKWTFLTNHTHVLVMIAKQPEIVLREVGLKVGITERAVQRIVADLEEEGFIIREKVGRKNSYQLRLNKPLRHPIEKHCSVIHILQSIIEKE